MAPGFTLSESPCRVNHAFSRDSLADDSPLRGGQVVKTQHVPQSSVMTAFEKAARRGAVLADQSYYYGLWGSLKTKWTSGCDNESWSFVTSC